MTSGVSSRRGGRWEPPCGEHPHDPHGVPAVTLLLRVHGNSEVEPGRPGGRYRPRRVHHHARVRRPRRPTGRPVTLLGVSLLHGRLAHHVEGLTFRWVCPPHTQPVPPEFPRTTPLRPCPGPTARPTGTGTMAH